MDFGGRVLASLDAGACRLMSTAFHADQRPAVASAWEGGFGLLTSVVQHEVNGHGGRAREFGLDPSYGASWDLTFYTEIHKDPETNEQNVLIAAAGSEASGVLFRQILLDLYRPEGREASLIPLAVFSKLDLPLYMLITRKPEPGGGNGSFEDQYKTGNDPAYYLVSRQALRNGADPADVANGRYAIDFTDPLLTENWRDARTTALWSLLDPALGFALYSYITGHIMKGEMRVHPPTLRLAEGYGLTASTRGALGISEVSRFLDIIATLPRAVATLTVRDLDSSVDRTWGWGLGLHSLRIGRSVEVGAEGDWWREPEAPEAPSGGQRWNATARVDLLFKGRWGLSAKAGKKTAGFFPGAPTESGSYFGFGVQAAF
jgi:hypothetical protein